MVVVVVLLFVVGWRRLCASTAGTPKAPKAFVLLLTT